MDKQDRKLFYDSLSEKEKNKRLEILLKVYENNKDNYNVIFQILKVLGSFSQYRERVKKTLILLENYYNPSSVYFELGKLEMLDGNYDSAIDNFNSSLIVKPKNSGALLEMGKAYLAKGDRVAAKEKFLKLAIEYDDKAAYYELGVLKEEEKDIENAKVYYKKVVSMNNKDTRALFRLGQLEKKSENFEKAKEYFFKVYKLNERDIFNLLELGRMEAELGNVESARYYFKRVLAIKEESAAHLELGILEESLENYDQAMSEYYKALNFENDKYAYFKVGCVLKQLGEFSEAKKYFFKIIDAENGSSALLEIVNLLLKENDMTNALYFFIKLLNNNLNIKGDERDFKRLDAYIRYKLGMLNFDCENENMHYVKQLVNYDEKNAIEASKMYFDREFKFEKELEKIRDNLNEENYYNTRGGQDYYIVDCGYLVGTYKGKETTKICVVTILNTDKIVFMTPSVKNKIKLNENERVRLRE